MKQGITPQGIEMRRDFVEENEGRQAARCGYKPCIVDPLADGRSAWARRWNDLVLTHAGDLGGYETLSEAQISICRRAATLECELESMEGRKSAGQPIEIEAYGRLASRLCRLLEMIGIKRLTKPPDALSELARAF